MRWISSTVTEPITILSPIRTEAEAALRQYLEGLRNDGRPSPLSRVGGTHFARWVIVSHFVQDTSQPHDDYLEHRYLLFTSNVDGPAGAYIKRLCRVMLPEARQIWGRCAGCSPSVTEAELAAYLSSCQTKTGLFFSAYPQASVDDVRHCLNTRERMIQFVIKTQALSPSSTRVAFIKEFPA